MSEQRPELRVDTDLPVRVFGMDSNGKPLNQHVRARNISSNGALLSGIEQPLKVGDIIGVQLEQKKARFRVVWVVDAGGIEKNQVGLQMQDGQECPWKEELAKQAQPGAAIPHPSNRRRRARHKVNINLELRDERTNIPMRVSATDISGNGCYVESILPLPAGTQLKVALWMDQEKLTTNAVVRTCDPGVGMGVEFMSLTREEQEHFQKYLEKLDPAGISGPVQQPVNNS
jgi:hypothetical protein